MLDAGQTPSLEATGPVLEKVYGKRPKPTHGFWWIPPLGWMLSLCCLTLRGSYCYSHFTVGEAEVETGNLQGHRAKPACYISTDCQATIFSHNTMTLITTHMRTYWKDVGCQPPFPTSARVLFRLGLGISYGLCVYNHKYMQFKTVTKSSTRTSTGTPTHTGIIFKWSDINRRSKPWGTYF